MRLTLFLLVILGMATLMGATKITDEKKPFEIKTSKVHLIVDVKGPGMGSESSQNSESSESSSESSESSSSSSASESSMSSSISFGSESAGYPGPLGPPGPFSPPMSSESSFSRPSPPPFFPSPESSLPWTTIRLPPEPEAAAAYQPKPSNSDSQDSNDVPPLGGLSDDSEDSQGCTTNCPADSVGSRPVAGPATFSIPLGDLNGDMVKVPRTETRARPTFGVPMEDLSKISAPAPALASVSLPSPVSLPTNTIGATTGCPGSSCLSPEEEKIRLQVEHETRVREEREKKKESVHEEIGKHMANIGRIDKLLRGLTFQYSQLRRSHELLRTHIGTNKAALHLIEDDENSEIGGKDDPLQKMETLDDIPEIPLVGKDVQTKLIKDQSRQSDILKAGHKLSHDMLKAFMASESSHQESSASQSSSSSRSSSSASSSSSNSESSASQASRSK